MGLSMLPLLNSQRHVAEACGIGPRQCVARLAPGHLSRCIPLSIPSILWAAQTIDEDDFDHTCDLQREFCDCTVSCTLDAC